MIKDKEYYNSLDKDSSEYIAYAKFNRLSNPKGISYETFKRDIQDLKIK